MAEFTSSAKMWLGRCLHQHRYLDSTTLRRSLTSSNSQSGSWFHIVRGNVCSCNGQEKPLWWKIMQNRTFPLSFLKILNSKDITRSPERHVMHQHCVLQSIFSTPQWGEAAKFFQFPVPSPLLWKSNSTHQFFLSFSLSKPEALCRLLF